VLFGSVKLFGIGIIVGVAFIHMLIPGDQLLISNNSPHFFREEHPHFSGGFVISGVTFAHLIQVLTSHILQTNFIKKKAKKSVTISNTVEQIPPGIPSIRDITETKLTNNNNNNNNSNNNNNNNNNNSKSKNDIIFLEVREFDDEVDKREKQFVFYLVELSVCIHSFLIGFAFGLTSVDKIIPLTFAFLFHQFFEGMAISTIFLEAKFTRIKPYLVMIAIFTLTLPVGAFIGISVRESFNDDDPAAIGIQGSIITIAAGILIYDSIANILSHHTNSKVWNTMSIGKKGIQMFCFYIGLLTMSVINTMI